MKIMNMAYTIILLMVIGLFGACEQEVATYDWVDCVQFEVKQNGQLCDSSVYSFAYEEPDVKEMPVTIRVQLTGEIKNYDRKVDIEIQNPTSADPQYFSFDPDTCYIRGGTNCLDLVVMLYRQPDMAVTSHSLTIVLKENEYFKTTNKEWITDEVNHVSVNLLRHTMYSSDIPDKPVTWDELWGEWSVKKFLLMCEETGFKRKEFQDQSFMGSGRKNYIKEFMNQYFDEYRTAHANDPAALKKIQEEDGTFMQMGK